MRLAMSYQNRSLQLWCFKNTLSIHLQLNILFVGLITVPTTQRRYMFLSCDSVSLSSINGISIFLKHLWYIFLYTAHSWLLCNINIKNVNVTKRCTPKANDRLIHVLFWAWKVYDILFCDLCFFVPRIHGTLVFLKSFTPNYYVSGGWEDSKFKSRQNSSHVRRFWRLLKWKWIVHTAIGSIWKLKQ